MYKVASIEVYTPEKMLVENGTTGVLSCTFKSNKGISSQASLSWSFVPAFSLNKLSTEVFFYPK